MNDAVSLGAHVCRDTGEMFEAFAIPPHLAERGSPVGRDGKPVQGSSRHTRIAKNPFRTWIGNQTDFEKTFRKS